MHGDLCKYLGIDSSTDHPDQHSNLFLNAYINRHVHTEYLKWSNSIVLQAYGMFFYIHVVLTPISTISSLCSTGNTRNYQQIDVYIYQCVYIVLISECIPLLSVNTVILTIFCLIMWSYVSIFVWQISFGERGREREYERIDSVVEYSTWDWGVAGLVIAVVQSFVI